MAQIEKTGEYTGLYHVLMGRVSALEGNEPEHLRIASLIDPIGLNPDRKNADTKDTLTLRNRGTTPNAIS